MPARAPSASLQRSGSARQGRAGSNAVHPLQPPVSAPEWATALNPAGSSDADRAASAATLGTSYNNPCFDKGAHSHNNEGLLGKGAHSHSHSFEQGVSAAGSLNETARAHKAHQEAGPGPLPCEAPLAAALADGGEAPPSPSMPVARSAPTAAAPPVQSTQVEQAATPIPDAQFAPAAAAATLLVPETPTGQPAAPIPDAQSAPAEAVATPPVPAVTAAQPAQAMPAAQSVPAAAAATPPVPTVPTAQSALAPERPAVAVRRLLHAVAAGGLQPEARASVWPQLLGCHSQDSTPWQLPGSCQGRQEAERLFRGLLDRLQNDEQVAGWYTQQGASEEWMLTHRRIVGDAQRLTVTPPFLQPGSASRTECVERLIRVLSLYALSDPELGYCQGMSDLAAPLLELWGQHAAQQGLKQLGPELQQLQQSMAHSIPSNAQDPQDLLSARQQLQASQQLHELQQQPEADTQQVSDQAHPCGKGRGAADKAQGRAAELAGEAGTAIQDTQQQQQHEAAAQHWLGAQQVQQGLGAQQAQQAEPPAGRHSELEADFCVFWCFSRLMRLVRQRFMGRMEVLREDLRRLSTLVQHLDPPLHRHLSSIGAGTFEFAFQMLLLLFRRELPWGESNRLWDGLLALYRLECPDDGWITAGGVMGSRVGDGGAAAAGARGRVEAEVATGSGARAATAATAGTQSWAEVHAAVQAEAQTRPGTGQVQGAAARAQDAAKAQVAAQAQGTGQARKAAAHAQDTAQAQVAAQAQGTGQARKAAAHAQDTAQAQVAAQAQGTGQARKAAAHAQDTAQAQVAAQAQGTGQAQSRAEVQAAVQAEAQTSQGTGQAQKAAADAQDAAQAQAGAQAQAESQAEAGAQAQAELQAQECEALRSLVIATAAALLQLHRPSLLRCRGLEEVVQLMNRLPDPGPGTGLKLAAAAAAIVREAAARAIVAGRKQPESSGAGQIGGTPVAGGGPTLAGARERGGKEATARGLCGLGC